jgi:rare lipoprotein A (peptidoglycan hydrolase)
MRRFRNRRRRFAALALLPVTATTMIATGATSSAADRAGIDADHHRVGPNDNVTLSGHFAELRLAPEQQARPGSREVRIQFRAIGADNWHDSGKTRVGRRGKFSERVGVARSGRFRAVNAEGQATEATKVRVKSETRARVSTKNADVGEKVRVKGRVAPGTAGRKIEVRVDGRTLRTRTGASGRFRVAWKADDAGDYTVRARAEGDRIAAGSGDKAGKVQVFRGALASWYGPGLYGNQVACGGTLQPDTIGVAHKSLRCGTNLTLRYKGREVDVEVIDRGPYVGDREFDLTEATKNKLRFPDTGIVRVSK